MNELVTHYRNENWTNSMIVAEKLGKSHKHVLRDIRKLLEGLSKLTAQSWTIDLPNTKKYGRDIVPCEKYVLEKYLSENGHEYERYRMNKPAFTLLLMQMTGEEALKIQKSFNHAFYEMEQFILKQHNTEFIAAREQGKLARRQVTDSIQELVEYAKRQGSQHAEFYYATVTKEIYKALGFLAQGEKVGSEFRNHLDNFQLAELFIAETIANREIEAGIDAGLHYKEIYLLAKQKVIDYGRSQEGFRIKPNKRELQKSLA